MTSDRRLDALADVPTMIEQGFPDFFVRHFDGLAVRAGTPREIVARLNADLTSAVMHPAVRERYASLALGAEPMTPARFGEVIARESARWIAVGRLAGIKAD